MKTKSRSLIAVLSALFVTASLWAATLSPTDKAFLGSYEKIRGALAADDLRQAQAGAASLGDAGGDIAKSQSLADARVSFARLSEKAEKLASSQSGYYVVHCPMAKKDWV